MRQDGNLTWMDGEAKNVFLLQTEVSLIKVDFGVLQNIGRSSSCQGTSRVFE